jgi:hypothetical protein
MSRLVVVLLLVGATTGALAAQTPQDRLRRQDEEIASLTRRRDSLAHLWSEASALVQLQDSLAHAASVGRLDTVAVGSLRIVSNLKLPEWRAAAEQYWPAIDSLYGDAAKSLESHPLLLQMVPPDSAGFQGKIEPWGVVMVPWDRGREDLVNVLRTTVTMPATDSALRQWLPGGARISSVSMKAEAGEAYVALVTASAAVAEQCFGGNLRSCRLALMLDSGPDPLVEAYPLPGERRAAVKRMENMFGYENRLKPAYQTCLNGSDSVCVDLLRTVPPAAAVYPLGTTTREFLVRLALQLGGRGAYQRLVRDPSAPIPDRVAAAAAMPIDSLIARWRSLAIAGKPAPVTLPAREIAIGLGWIVVLGICCVRSSRWRLG